MAEMHIANTRFRYSCKHDKPAALAERVNEVETIAKNVGTCMLTTVGTDGALVCLFSLVHSFLVVVYSNSSDLCTHA